MCPTSFHLSAHQLPLKDRRLEDPVAWKVGIERRASLRAVGPVEPFHRAGSVAGQRPQAHGGRDLQCQEGACSDVGAASPVIDLGCAKPDP